jgi:hypothetical protein
MSTKYSAMPSGQHFSIIDGLKFLAAAGLLTWFMFISAGRLHYNWQWYRVPKYLFTIVNGSFISGPLLEVEIEVFLCRLDGNTDSVLMSSGFAALTAS